MSTELSALHQTESSGMSCENLGPISRRQSSPGSTWHTHLAERVICLSGWSKSGQWTPVRRLLLVFVIAVSHARADPLAGQPPAAAFAPHDHWSRAILRRVALDGRIDAGAATAAWPLREDVVARLLSIAEAPTDSADATTPARSRGALRGYARLFAGERRDLVRDPRVRLGVRAGPSFRGQWNRLLAGNSLPDGAGYVYPGPRPTSDSREVGARVALDAGWRAVALRATVDPPHDQMREAYLSASLGGLSLWAGRRGVSLGAPPRGGIVLGEGARFDGGGVETAEPFRLPSFLGGLGDVRVSQTLARMERSGAIDDPWFLATRISFSPHARIAIGLNRAAMFGGEGNEGVNTRRVLLMLFGFSDVSGKDSDFENQVASADVTWRLPTSRPLALYAEYGTEDTGLAFVHVPAIILGVEAAVRRGSAWSGTIEHVRFVRSARTYPEWYRHGALGGGWSDDGVLLGHPLGGHGHETSLAIRRDDAPRGVTAAFRVLVRDRGEENLFAPDRAGTAVGGEARLLWFAAPGRTFELAGSAERGGDWSAGALTATFQIAN